MYPFNHDYAIDAKENYRHCLHSRLVRASAKLESLSASVAFKDRWGYWRPCGTIISNYTRSSLEFHSRYKIIQIKERWGNNGKIPDRLVQTNIQNYQESLTSSIENLSRFMVCSYGRTKSNIEILKRFQSKMFQMIINAPL